MYTYRGRRVEKKSKRKLNWRELVVTACTALLLVAVALSIALPIKAALPTSAPEGIEPVIQEAVALQSLENQDLTPPHDIMMTRLNSYVAAEPVFSMLTESDFELPVEDVTTDELVYTATRLGVEVREFDSSIDYSAVINKLYATVEVGSETAEYIVALCEIYELQRNLKIEYTGADQSMKTDTFGANHSMEEIEAIMRPHVPYMQYTETDVKELAALIYAEAGSDYMTDYHKQCVGSVVICRLEDPDTWHDYTIHDVIWHEGQYPHTRSNTYYDERCYNIALDLLENGPVVYAIWQANFPQGENVEYFEYPGLCLPTWIDK